MKLTAEEQQELDLAKEKLRVYAASIPYLQSVTAARFQVLKDLVDQTKGKHTNEEVFYAVTMFQDAVKAKLAMSDCVNAIKPMLDAAEKVLAQLPDGLTVEDLENIQKAPEAKGEGLDVDATGRIRFKN